MTIYCRRYLAIAAALGMLVVQAYAVKEADAPAVAGAPDSLAVLEAAVKQSSKDGAAWVRLGHAYLDAGDLKPAEGAFKKGVRYAKSAEAHNGLGLVYMSKGLQWRRNAFSCFRRALRADPAFVEAQMNIARLHTQLREPDAENAFKKAIQMDSTCARAYLELAEWYADRGYYEYEEDISGAFKHYIRLCPDDVEGHYGLVLTYAEGKRYGLALEIAREMMAAHPDDARWLAVAAQAHAARGDADRALDLFRIYLWMIPEAERALYEDLSLIAFPEELETYRTTPNEQQEAFLEGFWERRDLTLISQGKGRRAEHYRRVWYARTHFSKNMHPWDRRGEVYIRYGEPNYRSRSGHLNAFPGAAAESVKERNAYALQSAASVSAADMTEEVLFDGPEEADPGASTGGGAPLIGPVYPVEADKYPWESWVYTNVGGGTEFVFVDQVMNGRFDFPPPPRGDTVSMRMLSELSRLHPAVVLQAVASETPEHFDVPPGVDVLEFYYDMASFRGKADGTNLEIYYGIPPEQLATGEPENPEKIHIERTVVISDRAGKTVRRAQDEWVFSGGVEPAEKGTFVVDVASLEAPPGAYRLAVQLVDRSSGRWGIYLQEVTVPAYGDSLAMSDLELAWQISSEPQAQKFRKGDVWVIPMPTRCYRRDQNPSIYYEVYNLKKDEFGQTRYQVAYTIQQDVRRGVGLFGAVASGFGKLLSRKKPEVMVSYERAGGAAWEPIYLELDTKKIAPGLNQIEVTVTDMNGGGTVSRKAMLRLDRQAPEDQTQQDLKEMRERQRARRMERGRDGR